MGAVSDQQSASAIGRNARALRVVFLPPFTRGGESGALRCLWTRSLNAAESVRRVSQTRPDCEVIQRGLGQQSKNVPSRRAGTRGVTPHDEILAASDV